MFNFYSTADEINNAELDTVVIPIGSTEQHGPHLPLATDNIIAEGIAQKVAERLKAYLLPNLPISTCREHMGKKGSVWMNPDTFYKMLQDILLSLKEQGFKKIIIIQSHGGVFVLGPVVREMNATHPDIKVIKLDLMDFSSDLESANLLECKNNLHACECETSLILYLREDLVRKNLIEDSIPEVPRAYLNYGSIFKYSKNGVWGAPSLATKDKGKLIFEMLVDKCVEHTENILKFFNL